MRHKSERRNLLILVKEFPNIGKRLFSVTLTAFHGMVVQSICNGQDLDYFSSQTLHIRFYPKAANTHNSVCYIISPSCYHSCYHFSLLISIQIYMHVTTCYHLFIKRYVYYFL